MADLTEGGIPEGLIRRDPYAVLLGRARPSTTIAWPGDDSLQVTLWRLTDAESRDAMLEALHRVKDPRPAGYGLSEDYLIHVPELLDAETKYSTLARCLRDADKPERPLARDDKGAPDVERLRKVCDPDTREALFNAYLTFLDERSSLSRVESLAALEELVDGLGKGSVSEASLPSYDRVSLQRIALCAIGRLRTLTSANSSTSSSVNE